MRLGRGAAVRSGCEEALPMTGDQECRSMNVEGGYDSNTRAMHLGGPRKPAEGQSEVIKCRLLRMLCECKNEERAKCGERGCCSSDVAASEGEV